MRDDVLERDAIAPEREPLKKRLGQALRRAWGRFIAAQDIRAKYIARRHLATRSDATLDALGLPAEEIRRIRKMRRRPDPYWDL
jgi:hypothetical protein